MNNPEKLNARLTEVEKWKPEITTEFSEVTTTLRDDLDGLEQSLRKDIRKIRQETPSWLELNAVSKQNAEDEAKIIVDRVTEKAGAKGWFTYQG